MNEQVERDTEAENEYHKYDNMDEEEQYDVNEEICGKICWQGYHKCFDKVEENDLMGINRKRMVEDFKNCVEEEIYYCEYCAFKDEEMKMVNKHFFDKHRADLKFTCWRCEKEVKTINEFRQHVDSYHYTHLEQ